MLPITKAFSLYENHVFLLLSLRLDVHEVELRNNITNGEFQIMAESYVLGLHAEDCVDRLIEHSNPQ
jgi:hypothetical protein